MSAKYTFLAWDTPIDNAPLKLALLQLANNADDNGFSFYSISKMALACGMSEKTFQRKIKEMENMGILTVERRANRPSLYSLVGDEMGVTLCRLQESEATESLGGGSESPPAPTESPLVSDRESLVPNSTPNTSPKNIPNKVLSLDFEEFLIGYNAMIDNHRPNWPKCQSLPATRKNLVKNALSLVNPRAVELQEKPVDYLIRLIGAMAMDDKFFSGRPTRNKPEGYKCAFETNLSQKRISQAIDEFAGETE